MFLDGKYGGNAWTGGNWNGSEGTDMELVVDYQEVKTFDGVTLGFNKNMNSGVCPPSSVTYFVSDDGITYTEAGSIIVTTDVQSEYDNRGSTGEVVRTRAVFDRKVSGRYLKVVLKNAGTYQRPQGTTKTWIFMDELELYTIDPNAFAPWENENSEAYCEACGKVVSGWVSLVDNSTDILSSGKAAVGRIGDITTGKHYHLYLSESYTFEVCSAGLERALKRPSDFERFMGSKITVKLYRPRNGLKELPCELTGYEDGKITVLSGKETITFEKSDFPPLLIGIVQLTFTFGPSWLFSSLPLSGLH
jgi:hypothetical protein